MAEQPQHGAMALIDQSFGSFRGAKVASGQFNAANVAETLFCTNQRDEVGTAANVIDANFVEC